MNSERIRDEHGIYDDGPTTPEQTDADHARQLSRGRPRRERPWGTIWTHREVLPESNSIFGRAGFSAAQEELAAEMGEDPSRDEILDRMNEHVERFFTR